VSIAAPHMAIGLIFQFSVLDKNGAAPLPHYRTYSVVIGNYEKIFKSNIEFAADFSDEKSFPSFRDSLLAGLVKTINQF